ncbi:DUF4224 domain-containing protein [Undibacterium jejuense]|uniref:DUF4224 domain-containing protein n=1 Tax=Undibacterium jejuense TaxID=1344949 RepID=A0A923KQV0_9BURK|nr:DUF4224 domain-containing protein [Undibacterium jejuense]
MYLSAEQLSDLIGCEPKSFACMRRWLKKNGWPFVQSINGFPKVAISYHHARMNGQLKSENESEFEPDFGALGS